jgi:hypothetical protein
VRARSNQLHPSVLFCGCASSLVGEHIRIHDFYHTCSLRGSRRASRWGDMSHRATQRMSTCARGERRPACVASAILCQREQNQHIQPLFPPLKEDWSGAATERQRRQGRRCVCTVTQHTSKTRGLWHVPSELPRWWVLESAQKAHAAKQAKHVCKKKVEEMGTPNAFWGSLSHPPDPAPHSCNQQSRSESARRMGQRSAPRHNLTLALDPHLLLIHNPQGNNELNTFPRSLQLYTTAPIDSARHARSLPDANVLRSTANIGPPHAHPCDQAGASIVAASLDVVSQLQKIGVGAA